jgi:hypothetical protein
MGMWRLTSKEEKTLLYVNIARIVNKHLGRKVPLSKRDLIAKEIFQFNKEFYDVNLMQMAEFIDEAHTAKVRTTKP